MVLPLPAWGDGEGLHPRDLVLQRQARLMNEQGKLIRASVLAHKNSDKMAKRTPYSFAVWTQLKGEYTQKQT